MVFKSQRAAQMAMNKAEKAYTNACRAANVAYRDAMASDADPMAAHDAAVKARSEAWDHGAAVYSAAKAQGHFVFSWHFSDSNPTRDLIAANID